VRHLAPGSYNNQKALSQTAYTQLAPAYCHHTGDGGNDCPRAWRSNQSPSTYQIWAQTGFRLRSESIAYPSTSAVVPKAGYPIESTHPPSEHLRYRCHASGPKVMIGCTPPCSGGGRVRFGNHRRLLLQALQILMEFPADGGFPNPRHAQSKQALAVHNGLHSL
jgi:hypothetical protein